MVFILQYLHTHYSCNSYIYRGSQLLVCIRQSHLANMSTFQRQTPTSCYSIYSHFLFISLFALSITQCKSQSVSFSRWDGNQTYEYGSTYDKNLITVLGELVQNTPMTGLNVSSHGDSPNRVYGLLQCRGDASSEECYNCCQNATEFVAALCSNASECRMWYEVCELHYRNYSTISTTSTDVVSYGPGTLDSTGYNTSFQKLLYNLSVEASASSKRFAAGSSVDSSGQKIYALVQCFADISTANCSYCLSKAIEQEDNYLSRFNRLSTGIYLESCFLLLSNQTSFSQTNNSKQLHVNLGVRGGVLVVITLLLLLL